MRELATMLLEPLALTSWALLALNALVWRQAARPAVKWFAGILTVVFMSAASPFGANELQGWLEDQAKVLATCEPPPPRSVVVVLAGGLNGSPEDAQDLARMKGETFRRTMAAVRLAARVSDSVLVMSGGAGGDVREADLMRSLAVALGAPPARVLVERQSRSTFGSASQLKPLLASLGDRSTYLVTSAMHMRRAAAVFGSMSEHVCPWPVDFQRQEPEGADALVPRVMAMLKTAECMREIVAYAVYRLQGRISGTGAAA